MEGNVCVEEIVVNTTLCLVPCEGIFTDVKKLPAENITDKNTEMFIERYKLYKRDFEPSDGMILFVF